MSEKLQIRYSGFWDFPLAFTVRWEGNLYLFFREFDDERDDYEDDYRVFLLPPWTEENWEDARFPVEAQAREYLGKAAVRDVLFDPTHRQEIDAAIFQTLNVPREAVGATQ